MGRSPNRQREKSPKPRPSWAASSFFSAPFKDPLLRWASRRLPCQHPGSPAPRRPAAAASAGGLPAPNCPEAGKVKDPAPPDTMSYVLALPALNRPGERKGSAPAPVERRNIRNKGKSVEKNDFPPDEGAAAPTSASRSSDRFFLRSRVEKPEKSIQFSLTLTDEEIMEDLFIMTGKKPSARPKRHPKNVQKHLAGLFPGADLPEKVTPEMYDVNKWGRDTR